MANLKESAFKELELSPCPFPGCRGSSGGPLTINGWPHAGMAVCNDNYRHKWYWCNECYGNRPKVWTTKRTLNYHTKQRHSYAGAKKCKKEEKEKEKEDSAIPSIWSSGSEDDVLDDEDAWDQHDDWIAVGNDHSKLFFEQNGNDAGCAFLVAKSQDTRFCAGSANHWPFEFLTRLPNKSIGVLVSNHFFCIFRF